MRRLLFLIPLLLLAVPAFGQGSGIRFGDWSPVQSGQTPGGPIYTVPNATINFCNSPANGSPCTNKATTYTDITLATPCSTSTQVTLAGSSSCVATTDQYGNWGVWVSPGTYTFTITIPNGNSIGPYTVTLSGGGSGTNLLPLNNTFTGINNFVGGINFNGLPGIGASSFVTLGDCVTISQLSPPVVTDGGTCGGGGGGSGIVVASPRFQIGSFPTVGSVATIQGASGIATDSTFGNLYFGNAVLKGPNPQIDVQAFGARPLAVNPSTTCTTSGGGPPYTTLNCASATGLLINDGLAVYAAGAATTQTTPSAPTVTSPVITGSATYSYECVGVDILDGLTAASSAGTVSTAPAVFGNPAVSISGVGWTGGVVTITTSTTFDANFASYSANTKHANIVGMGTGLTTLNSFAVLIASEPSATSFTFALAGSGSGVFSGATARAINTFAGTAASRSGQTLTVTTDIASNIQTGIYSNPVIILLTGWLPADINGEYKLSSNDSDSVSGTTITINRNALSETESSTQNGFVTVYEKNVVTCPNIASPTVKYAVYGTSNPGGTEQILGFTDYNQRTFTDWGYRTRNGSSGFHVPGWLPSTPPSSAQAQMGQTKITGIAVNVLTVSPGVGTAVTNATSVHDDAEGIVSAANSITHNQNMAIDVVLSPPLASCSTPCPYHIESPTGAIAGLNLIAEDEVVGDETFYGGFNGTAIKKGKNAVAQYSGEAFGQEYYEPWIGHGNPLIVFLSGQSLTEGMYFGTTEGGATNDDGQVLVYFDGTNESEYGHVRDSYFSTGVATTSEGIICTGQCDYLQISNPVFNGSIPWHSNTSGTINWGPQIGSIELKCDDNSTGSGQFPGEIYLLGTVQFVGKGELFNGAGCGSQSQNYSIGSSTGGVDDQQPVTPLAMFLGGPGGPNNGSIYHSTMDSVSIPMVGNWGRGGFWTLDSDSVSNASSLVSGSVLANLTVKDPSYPNGSLGQNIEVSLITPINPAGTGGGLQTSALQILGCAAGTFALADGTGCIAAPGSGITTGFVPMGSGSTPWLVNSSPQLDIGITHSLGLTFAGSAGLFIPSGPITTNMTGGPNCVHETSGVLSATSGDCSTGGTVNNPNGSFTKGANLVSANSGTGAQASPASFDSLPFNSGADWSADAVLLYAGLPTMNGNAITTLAGVTAGPTSSVNPFSAIGPGIEAQLPCYPIALSSSTSAWVINSSDVDVIGCGGSGSSTRLNASGSFPASTPIATMGVAGSQRQDLSLRRMSLNCGSGPGTCTTLTALNLNEGSEVTQMNLLGGNSGTAAAPLVLFSGNTAGEGHFLVMDNQCGASGAQDCYQDLSKGTSGGMFIRNTANNTGKITGLSGIHFASISSNNTINYSLGMHAEGFANTCEFDAHTGGTCDYADSSGVNTNVLLIHSGALTVAAEHLYGSGTNLISDLSITPNFTATVASYPNGFGFYTNGAIGANTFIDTALTAGTSPICPNGTNGAFTTSGCSGGGGTPGGSLYSLQYNNTTFAGSTVPTTNGQYYPVYNVTASAAVAPQIFQVGMSGRAITGSSSSDTVAYSDNGTVIDHDIGCSSALTETLPTATTLLNPGFVFSYSNHCNNTDTISPSTWTIQSATTAAASTLSVGPGIFCRIKVDPNSSTNWLADCSVATSASGTVTSVATSAPISGGTITNTGTISCPTCVTSASSLTSGQLLQGQAGQAIAVADLTGDCTTSGTLALTCTKINGTAFPASALAVGSNGSSQPIAASLQGTDSALMTAGTVSGTGAVLCTDASGGATTSTCTQPTLNQIGNLTASKTFADGNNPLAFNSATTTNSQTAFSLGETTAATGTSDVEVGVSTAAGSTAIPLQVTQGAGASGAAPPSALALVGGAGGAAATVTSGGNVGGGVSLTAGAGSAGGATSGTGGAGGAFNFTAGAGGNATSGSNTGGGGSFNAILGAAGTGGIVTNGGYFNIQAGASTGTPSLFRVLNSSAVMQFQINASNGIVQDYGSGVATSGVGLHVSRLNNTTPVTVAANVTTAQNLQSYSVTTSQMNTVGYGLHVVGYGFYSLAANTPTLTFAVNLGALTLCTWTTGVTTTSAVNAPFQFTCDAVTTTSGSSAALEAHGTLSVDLGATNLIGETTYGDTNTTTVSTVDLSSSKILQVTVASSAASTSNSFTERALYVSQF